MNCIVADAGPLIALAKLELLELPRHAFGQVLVPQTVLDECREQAYSRDAVLITEAQRWPRLFGQFFRFYKWNPAEIAYADFASAGRLSK